MSKILKMKLNGVPITITRAVDFYIKRFGCKINFYNPPHQSYYNLDFEDFHFYGDLYYPTVNNKDDKVVRKKINLGRLYAKDIQAIVENLKSSKTILEFMTYILNSYVQNKSSHSKILLSMGLKNNGEDIVVCRVSAARLSPYFTSIPKSISEYYAYAINVILKYYYDWIELKEKSDYKSVDVSGFMHRVDSIKVDVFINYKKLIESGMSYEDAVSDILDIVGSRSHDFASAHISSITLEALAKLHVKSLKENNQYGMKYFMIGKEQDAFHVEAIQIDEDSDWDYFHYIDGNSSQRWKIDRTVDQGEMRYKMAGDYFSFWEHRFNSPRLAEIHGKTLDEIIFEVYHSPNRLG